MTLQLRVPDGTFIKLAYRGIVVGVAQTFGGRFYRAMLYAPALRKSGAPEGRRSPLDIETLPFTLHAEDGTDLQPGRTIRLTNLTGGWSTDEANGDAIAIEAFTPIIEDTVDKLTFNVEIENGKYTFQVVDGRTNVLRHHQGWIGDWQGPGGKGVIGLIAEVDRLRNVLPPKPADTRMTSYPVWFIIDPDKVRAGAGLRPLVERGVFGVWFDGPSAERAHHDGSLDGEYGPRSYVYCGSGHRSVEWKRLYDARPNALMHGPDGEMQQVAQRELDDMVMGRAFDLAESPEQSLSYIEEMHAIRAEHEAEDDRLREHFGEGFVGHIHDEMIFEVPEADAPAAVERIRKLMEEPLMGSLPKQHLTADVQMGMDWKKLAAKAAPFAGEVVVVTDRSLNGCGKLAAEAWPGDIIHQLASVVEEIGEVAQAVNRQKGDVGEEIGDAILTLCNLAVKCGLNPDILLARARKKVEKKVAERAEARAAAGEES